MDVKKIMERVGLPMPTGRAVAYIKDALEEMNLYSPTHIRTVRMDIVKNKRFYDIPNDMVKLLEVRCKDHKNDDSVYRTIPRMATEPRIVDTDGE